MKPENGRSIWLIDPGLNLTKYGLLGIRKALDPPLSLCIESRIFNGIQSVKKL